MLEDKAAIVTLLKGLKPFEGLSDDQLGQVAAVTRLLEVKEGESIELPLDRDFPFYAVATGKVRQTLQSWRKEKPVLALKKNDFFGADVAILGRRHPYTITAAKPTQLLTIEADKLALLLHGTPKLKENLRAALATYRLLHSKRFDWLTEDENVLLITHKHPAHLAVALIGPVALGWGAVIFFLLDLLITSAAFQLVVNWLGIGVLVAAALWAVWAYIDHTNDFYVVSEERVVWIESMIGLYDSRNEAPLSAIKNEEVKTSFLGRMLGFGTVINHAFMGEVRFENIPEPGKVRDLIESVRKTTAGKAVAADRQTMVNLVKRRINPPPPPLPAPPPAPPAKKRLPLSQRLGNAFSTYIVAGDSITYRKHIFILLARIALPSLLMVALLALAIWLSALRLTGRIDFPSPLVTWLTALLLFVPLVVWWGYQYVDWSNDIYRVTSDKIIDSEKKPLGDEVTNSAPLENILSMSLERKGLVRILLNYGDVLINTGTDTKFTFLNINDPARAQRDIYAKKYALEQKHRAAEIRKRGEEIVDWLAAYHSATDELHNPKDSPQT